MSYSKRFVLVVFAALVARTTELHNDTILSWPSLRFNFSVKRTAMQVHDQSEFSVLATPVVSLEDTASVLYDAFTKFKDGKMVYKYSLVDGVASVFRSFQTGGGSPVVECSRADILLSVNSIVDALGNAKAVSTIKASDGSVISCLSGNTYKILVGGTKFGVCYYESSGFTMFGSDMDIKVEYLTNSLQIRAPKLAGKTKKSCEKVASPSVVTPIGRSFLAGEPIPDEERMLDGVVDVLLSSPCKCKSPKRPCVFLHGLGVLSEAEENLDSLNEYWGNVTDHLPCCTSVKYAKLNTVNNSWTDHLQQQKVCDRVLAVSETSTGFNIADTILITHSMGGLMIAGAIANKKCELASSSTWVSIGSPMLGSMASDYFQDSCKHKTNILMEKFVKSTNLCPADDAIKSLAYQYENYSTPALNKLFQSAQETYRENVHAVMCSNSYFGIFSSYQAGFWILGKMIPHKSSLNDGMVEFFSCAGGFPENKFRNTYRKPFYVSELNHHDLAFRAGDALLDEGKMPVKWLECLL